MKPKKIKCKYCDGTGFSKTRQTKGNAAQWCVWCCGGGWKMVEKPRGRK